MFALRNLFETRYAPIFIAVLLTLAFGWLGVIWPLWRDVMWVLAAVMAALFALGIHDLFQTRHAILRNYPITAHMRFMLEGFRPEIRQYFFEGDKDGAPFPRDKRAIVYQRAKRELINARSARCLTSIRNSTNGCTTRWHQSLRSPYLTCA